MGVAPSSRGFTAGLPVEPAGEGRGWLENEGRKPNEAFGSRLVRRYPDNAPRDRQVGTKSVLLLAFCPERSANERLWPIETKQSAHEERLEQGIRRVPGDRA